MEVGMTFFQGSKSGHPIPQRSRDGRGIQTFYQAFKMYVAAELEELLTTPGLYDDQAPQTILNQFRLHDRLPENHRLILDLVARCSQDVHLTSDEYYYARERWFGIPVPTVEELGQVPTS